MVRRDALSDDDDWSPLEPLMPVAWPKGWQAVGGSSARRRGNHLGQHSFRWRLVRWVYD